jgi:hypothetical protein
MALTKVDSNLLQDGSQGFTTNPNVVVASYSIPTGTNAVSTGPITINSGVTVTVPSGQRWVIL